MYTITLKNGNSYLTDLIWRKKNGIIFDFENSIIEIRNKQIEKIDIVQAEEIKELTVKCS
ncbi:MAG: hypothetical protein A2015_02440 [Spirochaetes bacterium GWF1_31_7]|nr:MAG: hypothetical protein A2Y30_06285 [Spirochaetes bacterium GWE1_32_154]OHD50715.1 MAG: hypothetical protein A2Y29_09210 [Spirochaetes bacterium GWE2_31_10]OHD50771.1 MAG: hypothetical protein A2015_02440 [Spirochaetes bacterium GWF1_31_7]OHD73663.1 MAG: hypothetical protein A2355_11430 [Spirochaetes bacterium RIFOXYB1_FULL_32_8]HBD95110.1 hypothetical protein [Spirochaetia bacterium]